MNQPISKLKQRFLTCLLMAALAVGLTAQNRSFGTLPLANKPGASLTTGAKLENTPEYAMALSIYNRLVEARGDFRYPVPKFTLKRTESSVAYMDYEALEIVLEEKAFQVCRNLGAGVDSAAIALLLGHELTHYYEKHAWRRGFAADYRDLPIGMQLDSLLDDVANETEADYLGGFLAYSAGFGLFGHGDTLMHKLYKAYGLGDQMGGYPDLADRMALSRRSAEKMQNLVDVFEMANLLTATGNFSDAYAYYQYVLQHFQSRETYNNLGVSAVLDAIQRLGPAKVKYGYPLTLDLESSATKGDGMVDITQKILTQAIFHFDAAISLDPNYAPAYLNKACALALLKDFQRARFYADVEARRVADGNERYAKTANDIDILLGILAAEEGDSTAADAKFNLAATAGSNLAKNNLRKLRNEPIVFETMSTGGVQKAEKIDGLSMALLSSKVREDWTGSTTATLGPRLSLLQDPNVGANSRLLISQNDKAETFTFFHLTGPGYTGKTTQGAIGLGADRTAITEAFGGEPIRSVETPRGEIMVYKKIIFFLGPDQRLEKWATWLQEKQ